MKIVTMPCGAFDASLFEAAESYGGGELNPGGCVMVRLSNGMKAYGQYKTRAEADADIHRIVAEVIAATEVK